MKMDLHMHTQKIKEGDSTFREVTVDGFEGITKLKKIISTGKCEKIIIKY